MTVLMNNPVVTFRLDERDIMKSSTCPRLIIATIIVFLSASVLVEAAPPVPVAPPATLWNFLGIPGVMHKMRDTTLNRRGNNPGAERKDPIKRLADPANLQSENPAIKKAAEIKADQDLAPQKIKAIKFLATVGCDCYGGVKEALLESLDDCTEEVRYEAALAFCQAAGNPCCNCGKSCCNAQVMQKLHDIAFGQDEKCCYKETSARVRAAAEMALNACKRKVGPTTPKPITPIPDTGHKPEVPLDEPSDAPKVEPLPTPASPAPADEEKEKEKEKQKLNSTQSSLRILNPPEALEGFPSEEQEQGSPAVIQATATELVVKPIPAGNNP
jgi:hypothetical protein